MPETPESVGVGSLAGKRIAIVGNTDWSLYNFRLPIAVEARRLGAEVTLVTPDGPHVAAMRQAGFRHHEIQMSQRGMNPLQDLLLMGQLGRLYHAEGFELVHHCSIKPVIYGSLAARLAGTPAVVNAVTGLGYVFSEGGGGGRRLVRRLVETLYHVALSDTHCWAIFQNRSDQDFFETKGWVAPSRSVTIPGSGVDVDVFRADPARTSSTPVALFLGRLLRDKGVETFHEVARRLKAQGSDAEFWIAGGAQTAHPGGVPQATLEAWRREGVVQLLGHRSDIRDVIQRSWVVVLPSLYGEGVPKSLLEAAALGKPLVAYDVGGCRDIVRPGVSGVRVPPGDVEALATAVGSLLRDGTSREVLGAGARRLVERDFSLRSVLERSMATYVAALRGTR
ncbi:MAG TPA: glycosyltransferase family 4 protein [Longimicrobiales bacterium]|nr:glycosyltransferase family 4 protein [Longimicrobiales bacterium]